MTRTWIVTGSARGLGRDLTEAALEAGHAVLATARRPEQLDDLVARYGDRVRPFALDVTDPAGAEAAVAAAVEVFGGLDVVVNNAGWADLSALEDTSIASFRAQLDTNLMGVVHLTKAAVPIFREQRSGHVIQISSVGGRVASPGLSAYQAAKWAVGGFSEVVAAEVAPFGVRVTVVEPGGMRTEWASSSMTIPEVSAPYRESVGARAERMGDDMSWASGDPRKVADVVVRIAAEENPPLRLLLGSDAFAIARAAADLRAEEDLRLEPVTRSTDATT
ncbi:SDR family NAD(P)-dependent oxidoreductase [Patulibacter sp.]|uniref:SDR family NAD(P)-dependent oxidoreductase n=1 Tax=Patulibacter sp. TaxID=1912859 RepID=UPI00271C1C1A|nr:SDR family NAD(P)-dependent oxidoreductase [Patulibacter sp.]MDO9407814.1 SDR family NAD(P)-dependent oxidoreductase [Patulibacter sp.]